MVTSMLFASCNNATTQQLPQLEQLLLNDYYHPKPHDFTDPPQNPLRLPLRVLEPGNGGQTGPNQPTAETLLFLHRQTSPAGMIITLLARPAILSAMEDQLTGDDWTLDPSIFAYQLAFRPSDYSRLPGYQLGIY